MKREHLLKGAEREAVAAADLMRRGFEVFRAMGNFSCDLLAQQDGEILRVEVKGTHSRGRKPPTGFSGVSNNSHYAHCERFDILATVVDSQVFYVPSVYSLNSPVYKYIEFTPQSSSTTKKNLERQLRMRQ